MEIAICAIARLENKYIKEWVDYHLALGFSHIYIYDNNREGEERITTVLDINNTYKNSVTLVPYHNVDMWPQMQAYNDCWDRFSFEWILFIDIDEFFTFGPKWTGEKTIQAFVTNFESKWDAVLINWMCFGDNGLIEYDSRPLVERFKKPLPLNFSKTNMWGKQPLNGHVKTLVRHDCNFSICNPHIGSGNYRCCNPDGNSIENKAWQETQTYDCAYIRHYITKTISEYAESKAKRGFADREKGENYSLAGFFSYNKPTIRKIRIYKQMSVDLFFTQRNNWLKWLKLFIKHWIFVPFQD